MDNDTLLLPITAFDGVATGLELKKLCNGGKLDKNGTCKTPSAITPTLTEEMDILGLTKFGIWNDMGLGKMKEPDENDIASTSL